MHSASHVNQILLRETKAVEANLTLDLENNELDSDATLNPFVLSVRIALH